MGKKITLRLHRTPTVRPLKAALRLAVVKAVAISFALVAGYVAAAVLADLGGSQQPDVATADQAAARLFAEHECYTSGLDRREMRSAFVREGDGLRQVTLDEARQVWTGERPGTLVALCRAPR